MVQPVPTRKMGQKIGPANAKMAALGASMRPEVQFAKKAACESGREDFKETHETFFTRSLGLVLRRSLAH